MDQVPGSLYNWARRESAVEDHSDNTGAYETMGVIRTFQK
jgi:hypothetical protein